MAPRKRPSVEGMRNVSAFLSQPVEENSVAANLIDVSNIRLPQRQPRRYFDPAKLAQLKQSIQEHGILEPLLVRPLPNGAYELVAGERRLKAAQALGLTEVPIVSKALNDQEAVQVALIENLQREDLNPIEETEALLELLTITLSVEPEEVISLLNRANHAKNRNQQLEDNVILQIEKVESVLSVIGRFTSESFRANRLPLLNLPEDVLETLRQGKLEYTKARTIARVKDEANRQQLLEQAIANDLSLSQIREQIAALKAERKDKTDPTPSLKQQMDDAYRQVKKSKVWDNPKRRKRLEKLLA
ncbi:MAG TPA: ParB/RepB/Spo0J family partition protein, partial [Thermosynechococcaceae cyanobacterium]